MAGLSRLDSAYLKMQTNDYSTLFNSMNRSSSSKSFNMFDVSGNSSNSLGANFYADYASLKNGSYFKLAKSYYGKQASETETSSDTKKAAVNETKAEKAADTSKTDAKKTEEAAKPDYVKAASEISQEAKALGGYSQNGMYGSVDTAGILFNSVT